MSDRARTLGPPARLVLAWLAVGAAATSSTRASGRATADGGGCGEPLEHWAAPCVRFRPNSPGAVRTRCAAHANGTSNQQVDAKTRQ